MHIAGRRLAPSSEAAYARWVRKNALAWIRKGRIPPFQSLGRAVDHALLYVVNKNMRRASRLAENLGFTGTAKRWREAADSVNNKLVVSRRYAITWALQEAIKNYTRQGQA